MAEKGAFKVGDIVKLKSGGPPMTVSTVKVARGAAARPSSDWCVCIWFDGAARNEGQFNVSTLEPERRARSGS